MPAHWLAPTFGSNREMHSSEVSAEFWPRDQQGLLSLQKLACLFALTCAIILIHRALLKWLGHRPNIMSSIAVIQILIVE